MTTYRTPARDQVGPAAEIDVLWITAGLGCDGDTIAITAATQPSVEEIVMGAIPGIPRVNFHNSFLSYENGAEFMERFHRAADGKFGRFILVIEGSIPNENNKEEGYWLGLDPLYVANEGKLIAVAAAEIAEQLVTRIKQNVHGRDACIIGEVKTQPQGIVAMRTGFGGTRIVDMLVGEQLPRIC